MLTYAQVSAKMVREGDLIEFKNLHNVTFRIWQAGVSRVQLQNQNTMETYQYNNVKNALIYANFCN